MCEQRKERLLNKQVEICCVVPIYNESANVVDFVTRLDAFLQNLTVNYRTLLVDDGSHDDSLAKIYPMLKQNPTLRLLALSRNFGKEIALTAGLDHTKAEVVIILDGDGQHPLDLIPQFLEQWAAGYDMVYGIQEDRQHESWLKRRFTQSFYAFMQAFTRTKMPPNAGDFRLLDRSVVNALRQCHDTHRFMKGLYAWVGFKTTGIPFTPLQRESGQSSWRFFSLAELAITGITSFSSIPLRIWGLIGLLISLCALIYASFIVIHTLLYGVDVPGYATLVVAIMFFGGIQLLSIGILGEYIGRIFEQGKRRPHYFIREKLGFDDDQKSE